MAGPYIKVSTQIGEHYKILRTPREFRWAYIELLCYSARNLTDGYIPAEYANLACTTEEIEALASNRLLGASPGGWQIHGYLEWQTDSELIEKRREAGRIGGVKSGETRRAKSKQNAKQSGPESKQTPHDRSTVKASASNPDELEVEEEVEVEELQLLSPTVPVDAGRTRHTYSPDFEAFWKAYPRRQAKGAAAKAYAKAAKSVGRDALVAAATRYASDPNLPKDRTKIPHAATWLNDERWNDDDCPPDAGQRAGTISAYAALAAQLINDEQAALPATQQQIGIAQ